MNFDRAASPWNMPELGWRWGYVAVLGLMLLMVMGMLVFFYRKGWLGEGRAHGLDGDHRHRHRNGHRDGHQARHRRRRR